MLDRWLFATPSDAGFLRWKCHRVMLKHGSGWYDLEMTKKTIGSIQYLAEGMVNYLFRVQGESRLLKITRKQFYNLNYPMDSWIAAENCRIANLLAADGLGPRTEHVWGGAILVEDAGPALKTMPLTGDIKAGISRWFEKAAEWSRKNGLVLLDYNEGNWCWRAEVLCVDVDARFVCPLEAIREHPLVCRRLEGSVGNSNDETLDAFLAREKDLLLAALRK